MGELDVAGGRPRKHTASLPLGVQCQLEFHARAPEWSVTRVVARCFLITAFAHSLRVRLNDADGALDALV